MLDLLYICSECVYVYVYRIYTYKVYMHWKYIKHICIYLLYPFSRLYQSTISQRKDSFFFKAGQKGKQSWFNWEQGSLFPWVHKTISFPLLPLSKRTRKLSFFKKKSPLLFYHIFLKFHKNMIVFFKRMSFGNSHELIIKYLMFSFSVISYLSFFLLSLLLSSVFYKYHGTLKRVTA